MAELFRLTIYWDPYATSPNRLRNPRMPSWQKGQLKDASREAALTAYILAGRPQSPGPVRVTPVVRRGRAGDDDAVYGGLKWARDVLFSRNKYGQGITPHDGPSQFRWQPVRFEVGRKWADEPHVILIVETTEE